MSLVITSNVAQEDNPEFSNAFKPFSYQNRLLNTMRIPPNSEIALQSAKINKNGLFVLDRANAGFCHYFGTPIVNDATKLAAGEQIADLASSTTQPFRGTIGGGAAFNAGGRNERNIEDMALDLKAGLDACAFHPSLIIGKGTEGADGFTSGITAEAKYDTDNSFKGFEIVTTQDDAALTTRDNDKIVFSDISKNNSYNFTQDKGSVTSSDIDGFYVQNREYPIAQNGGECVFDITGANSGPWMVGLSRINKARDIGGGDFAHLPPYFDNSRVNGVLTSGRFTRGEYRYGDFVVVRSGGLIRVFQTGSDSGTLVGRSKINGIYMNEIIYYGGHGGPANQVLGNNVYKVRFTLNNEEMKIEVSDNKGDFTLLADHATLKGGGKNKCLNPVNAAEWAMYPVMGTSGGAGGKVLKLESISHYASYPKYTDTRYDEYDWWGWSQDNNETTFCLELEKRPWNDASSTTLLAPKAIDAKGMNDYESIIITAKSVEYGNSTNECGSTRILGFEGQPVSIPKTDLNKLVSTNVSASVPKLISNISLFIRLNNFTQNSINARQGTNSKIVAHLPRFDNSGNETGGLYFEPHEKTYLALGNTDEILINSFDVDIVYENETLCTALTAKTVVCFHIRQMK
mgnify:CR=1 FL=1